MAHLDIGQILEARGEREEAEVHYQLAVKNRIYRAEDLTIWAVFVSPGNSTKS